MMPRKRSRAAGSSRAGPLQRLDEAGERGERRAQLVAGIGDEIGAHLLDAADRRQIVERDDDDRRCGRLPRAQPATRTPRPARSVGNRVRRTRCAAPCRSAFAARIASTSSGMRSAIEAGSPRRSAGASAAAPALKAIDAAVLIEHDHRIGQAGDDGVERLRRRRAAMPRQPAAGGTGRLDRRAGRTIRPAGRSSRRAPPSSAADIAPPLHAAASIRACPSVISASANGVM